MTPLRDRAVADATGDVQADEGELKRRKLAAETAKAELELAKARDQVAPLDQVERMVSKAFAQVRAGMRNIPGRTVTMLIPAPPGRHWRHPGRQVLREPRAEHPRPDRARQGLF
jgi:phage terminase Nu1 subunit (DNA packaging protein)